MKKERFVWLDEIKGYSVLCVVFCHFLLLSKESYLGNVMMSLAWGAVPCFMMVSGSLMHQKKELNWKKHFIRIGKIYGTMSIWKIIFLLSCMAFWEITFTKAGLIEYVFLFGNIDGVNTGVMWYMVSFLVVLFFFPVSQYLFHEGEKGRKLLFYIMCLLFAGSIMITEGNFVLHLLSRYIKGAAHLTVDGVKQMMPFTNSANMLFYFILGGYLFEYREKIMQMLEKWHGRTWIPVFLAVTGTAGLMVTKYTYTGSFVWGNVYLKDGYLRFSTLVLTLGVYLFFMAKERWGSRVLFAGIGKYTMGIYYLHYLILIFVSKFVFPYLTPYASFGLNCVKTIVITLLCVLISWIMKKIPLLKQLVE